jgi:hypothetical protein
VNVVTDKASSLDVTKLGDRELLERTFTMLTKLDQFVDEMRAALDAMPQLPFMPKFPRSNGK